MLFSVIVNFVLLELSFVILLKYSAQLRLIELNSMRNVVLLLLADEKSSFAL